MVTLLNSLVRSISPRPSAPPDVVGPPAPRLDITLAHRGQTRRYVVRQGTTPGSWTCELVLNGRHRSSNSGFDADSFIAHAQRSIAYLEEEGWTRVDEATK